MSYTIETKQVGRFNVNVHVDVSYRDWEDVLCDEPVMVLAKGRYGRFDVLFDNSKQVPSGDAIYFSLEDGDWEESIWHLDGLADFRWTDAGRFRLESDYFPRPRYFKDAESGLRSLARDVAGLDVADLRFKRFSTRDAEVLLVWSQSELDRYAGTKNACAPIETVRAFLDGDVLDSCWGYIGDAACPLPEA